jgi:shikimate kinase
MVFDPTSHTLRNTGDPLPPSPNPSISLVRPSAPAPLPPTEAGSPLPHHPITPSPRPQGAPNIYLCGMIGSGKTAIGTRLAAKLGRPFYDLDRELERDLGYSFHRLVQEQGWLAFRELEYAIVKRLAAMHDIVFALGGGTVRYAWNRDALSDTGITVLLEAGLGVLAERVRRADRPRVNPGVSLEEDLQRIWSSTGEVYRLAANFSYRTDEGRSLDEEVDDLWVLLEEKGSLARSCLGGEGENLVDP